jgi:hypothetical protein
MSPTANLHRGVLVAIGLLTAALSIWWLAAEVLQKNPAAAAKVGIIRGKLWLNEGLARSAAFVTPDADARAAFEQAAKLSPTNSKVWLAIAQSAERFSWLDQKASSALKMSYYTGFNSFGLVAPRLALLAATDTARDPEFGDILRRQISLIVTRAPSLKQAITDAYAGATPENQQTIEAELGESDPDLLRRLHRQ